MVETGFLRTRVARRVLLLFVLCAILPLSVLSLLAYRSVREQLETASWERLEDMARNAGSALIERLQFLEGVARLRLVPGALEVAKDGPGASGTEALVGFESALVLTNGRARVLFGEPLSPPALGPAEEAHLESGAAVLRVQRSEAGAVQVLLVLSLPEGPSERAHLWVRLDQDFLWSTASGYSTLPTSAGFCVFEVNGRPLHCHLPDQGEFLSEMRGLLDRLQEPEQSSPPSMQLEWRTTEGRGYLAMSRLVFLRPQFAMEGLFVAVSEDRSLALAPARTFGSVFLSVLILALATVGLLANIQIRKSLGPIEELQVGTRRIANGEFRTKVSVCSGDEFEELADSFNTMAARLEAQFTTLKTVADIDRAILSSLDAERIVETVLARAADLLPCERVSVCRLDWLGAREGRLWTAAKGGGSPSSSKVLLHPDDRAHLMSMEGLMRVEGRGRVEAFLGPDGAEGAASTALVVALRVPDGLAGFLAVQLRAGFSDPECDASDLQRLAEQLSVALSNARLLEELERMSWGALTALARTIDAKSPWTLGHSERVTSLAVALAREVRLPEASVMNLKRGGLVHDIGKIGIPRSILDKAGELSPEERLLFLAHPEDGVRILDPIPALEEVIPIVLHHHEAWDGSGYPAGLAGTEIPIEARVLAVADHFDALVSERPYRSGVSVAEAARIMRAESGRSLDPDLVDPFLAMLESGGLPYFPPSTPAS